MDMMPVPKQPLSASYRQVFSLDCLEEGCCLIASISAFEPQNSKPAADLRLTPSHALQCVLLQL
jgi:hypothetical protein